MKKIFFLLLLSIGFSKQNNAQNATCGSCYQPGFNLISTGSFNNSNVGFTNNLTFSPSGSSNPGSYAVRSVSSTFWTGGCNIYDHTSGSGTEMLCVDGKPAGTTIAWEKTMTGLSANQNYILSFYIRYGTCVGSIKPVISVAFNSAQVGDTIMVGAGNWRKVSYLWNSGNSTTATIQIKDTVQSGNGNDFIIDDLSFTLCSTTTTVNAGSDQITCAGSPVQLNSTGSGPGNCTWSGPAGLNNITTCSPVFNSTVPGDYTYTVSFISGGCPASDNISIHVNALPPVPVVHTFGDSVISSYATAYQWYSSSGAIAGATGQYYLPSQTGHYHVSITDPKGCSATSDSALFTLCSQIIQISAGTDKTICSGGQVALVKTGNGSGMCTWSGPAGLTSYTGCTTICNGLTSGNFTYTVTDTLMGCSASDNVVVNVLASPSKPVITRNADSLISTVANAYQWYSGGTLLAGKTSKYLLPSVNGYYKVVATNTNGCSTVSDSIQFIACSQLFTLQTISDLSICQGSSITLTTTPGGQGTCQWSGPAGLSSYSTFSPVFTATAPGDYTYIISGQLNGCLSSDSVHIHADALPPKPTITQHVDSLISDLANAYQWYYNSTPIPGATSKFLLPNIDGSYTVTAIDANGCSAESDPVIFNHCLLLVHIAASADTSICINSSVTLSAIGNGSGNCTWSGPAGLSNYQSCVPVFSSATDGQFTYIVTDTLSGCEAKDTVVISVLSYPAKPTITITGDSVISTTASTYQWYKSGQLLPGETNQYLLPAQAGYYKVHVTNVPGCTTASDSIQFTPCSAVITVQTIADANICAGTPLTLVTTGNGVGNCLWTGPAGLDNYNTCEPVFMSQTAGDYHFIVYDQLNGCRASDSLLIHVNDLPMQPVVSQIQDSLVASLANAYQWYASGTPLWFENNNFLIPDHHDYYYVEITDSNGCKSVSDSINPVFTGTYETVSADKLEIKHLTRDGYLIFSNPSDKSDNVTVDIYDNLGRTVFNVSVKTKPGEDTRVYIGKSISTIYVVRLSNGKEAVSRKFFPGNR